MSARHRPLTLLGLLAWLLLAGVATPSWGEPFELSNDERAWIADHPVVRIRVGSRPPFEMVQQGEAQGMAVDYVRLVCARLGITPVFIHLTGDKQAILARLAEHRGLDLVLLATPYADPTLRLVYSKPFVDYPFSLFINTQTVLSSGLDGLHGHTLALERGFMTNHWVARDHPEIQVLNADSTQDALAMVAFGKADAYLGNLAAGSYIVQQSGYHNIKAVDLPEYGYNRLALAATEEWTPFVQMFDRYLHNLGQDERSRIEQRWLYVSQDVYVYWEWVASVAGVAALLLALMTYWVRRLRHEVRGRLSAEQRLRAIFDQVGEAVYLLSLDTPYIIDGNQALCDILGYTLEELKQLPVDYFDVYENERHVQQRLERVRRLGQERYTTQWRTKGGELRRMEHQLRTLILDGRQLFIATAHDQTDLFLAKRALEEERGLFIAGPTVVFKWALDTHWPVRYASANVHALLGYSAEQLMQGEPNFAALVHPEDLPRVANEVGHYIGDPLCQSFEQHYRLRHRNGDYRSIYDLSVITRNDLGEATGVNGYVIDETPQVQAQERIRQLASILDATPDFVGISDAQFRPIYINPGARTMLGFGALPNPLDHAADLHPGAEDASVIHPPWARRQLREIALPEARERGFWSGESAILTHHGVEVPVSQTLIAHRDAQGQVVRYATVMHDIRQLKRLQSELEAAKERAEGANRAKSTFLANMSHELRTPLNAVLGYAQVLAHDPRLDPALEGSVTTIRKSGDYLLLLLNDILDLAKIEANHFELFPSEYEPWAFFKGLLEVFLPRASQKGLHLNLDYHPPIPEALLADERRMRQICMNLLGNAVKFTDQGEVRIEVSYLDGELHVAVSDTGIGISAERLSELFTPFQQFGEERYKQQGTGLGLAISKSLVEQMGGTLQVQSHLGEGSRFSFQVPQPQTQASSHGHSPQARLRITGYRRTDGVETPLRLLAVDDNQANRLLLVSLLAPLGFALAEAVDGLDGLQRAQEWGPDLILMDLVMPVCSGLEATRRLATTPGLAHIPVVAVSANAYAEDRRESRAAGCVAHLDKPVKLTLLLETLARHLPLEWLYAEAQEAREADGSLDQTQMVEALAQLPQALREQLRKAVMHGNRREIVQLIDALDGHSALKATLHQRIDQYEFAWVLECLTMAGAQA